MLDRQDYITIAKIGAPHGVHGDLKLHVFCQDQDDITHFKIIYILIDHQWQPLSGCQIKGQSGQYFIRFDDCHDRDYARQYTNSELAIERSALPSLAEDEYYQADLIGLSVTNKQGEYFGVIDSFLETGANDVLVIKNKQSESLIPCLDHVIISIDLTAKEMVVDWGKDYL